MLKIATWNVNSLNVRLPHLLKWLTDQQPDVIALQETKLTDGDFPEAVLQEIGYHAIYAGQKTYNGVAILSRFPFAADLITDIPTFVDPQRRLLAATVQDIRIINVYVPNGQSVDSDKYQYKLEWLEHLITLVKQQLTLYPKLVILGDFNIAPEDRDVHDPKLWHDQVLFSEPEKMIFQKLLQTGLHDAFRLFEQPEKIYSWWDYRQLALQLNKGMRIDHILISDALKEQCKTCLIDKQPRKWERPSDHAPVIVEIM